MVGFTMLNWVLFLAIALMSNGAFGLVLQPGAIKGQSKDTLSSSDLVHKTTIFSGDSRQVVRNKKAPWSAIGRLANPKDKGCTAFLVGRRIIATNAHCVIDKDTKTMMTGDYRFYPSYRKGQAPYEAKVTYIWFGTNDPRAHRGHDWALLVLDWAVGDKVGWFGSRDLSSDDLLNVHNQHTVYMAGYSDDNGNSELPFWERCRFEEYLPDLNAMGHSCSSTNGASGSPILLS